MRSSLHPRPTRRRPWRRGWSVHAPSMRQSSHRLHPSSWPVAGRMLNGSHGHPFLCSLYRFSRTSTDPSNPREGERVGGQCCVPVQPAAGPFQFWPFENAGGHHGNSTTSPYPLLRPPACLLPLLHPDGPTVLPLRKESVKSRKGAILRCSIFL